MELALESYKQVARPVGRNDLTDLLFLAVAIPYCDIVVTERFWADIARRTTLLETYSTVVLTNLAELPDYLQD
jgi:hypothetical protein